jgi:hypothetical protein
MSRTDCKYPDVTVRLVGEDGNAFAVLARVTRAMREAKIDGAEIKAFQAEHRRRLQQLARDLHAMGDMRVKMPSYRMGE